jgi:DNA-binding response OmpR family regulator
MVSVDLSERTVLLAGGVNAWAQGIVNCFLNTSISTTCIDVADLSTALASAHTPSVIVVDLGSVHVDEHRALCTRLRMTHGARVIALGSAGERAMLLDSRGALVDTFIAKPFGCRDVADRITALLAREPADTVEYGPKSDQALRIDVERREVRRNGSPIALSRTQFDILALLARDPGHVVARGEILAAVWGPAWQGSANNVDVHIGQLRRRLGDNPDQPRIVQNVRGVGFRLRS